MAVSTARHRLESRHKEIGRAELAAIGEGPVIASSRLWAKEALTPLASAYGE